jgi:hypothetical protein
MFLSNENTHSWHGPLATPLGREWTQQAAGEPHSITLHQHPRAIMTRRSIGLLAVVGGAGRVTSEHAIQPPSKYYLGPSFAIGSPVPKREHAIMYEYRASKCRPGYKGAFRRTFICLVNEPARVIRHIKQPWLQTR